MKRILILTAGAAVVGGIFWAMVSNLEQGPSDRDDPPAVILRPPEGFVVEHLGTASMKVAAAALYAARGDRVGVDFSEGGDDVIVLADRDEQKIIEMRAARSGTLVERTWSGEVDRRLVWAADNGNLDAPGLPPSTGKNLYH